MRQAIRWLLRWHRRRCARLPCAPLAVLLALALPLSCWASPLPFAHSAPRVLILAASIGLSVALAGAARRRPQADAQRLDAATWLYLALGVAVALAGGALPANERAGILLLFTPLAVAVACAPPADTRAAWRRLQLATLALLLLAASIDAGSRGGLAALALALAAAALAAAARRHRPALALLLVAVLAAVAAAGADFLLFDGSPQGLSSRTVLRGRGEIWDRALLVWADTPLTGIGMGTFGTVVERLYPVSFAGPGQPLEDAHNLFLQTALDLGPAGLAALLALCLAAGRHLRRALPAARGMARARIIGLGAALLAFLLFSVTDAVALGTPGSVAFWLLLGLVFATPESSDSSDLSDLSDFRTMARWATAAVIAGAGLLVLPAAPSVAGRNLASLDAMRAALVAPATSEPAHRALRALDATCRPLWLAGQLMALRGDARREADWRDLLRCTGRYLPVMAVAAPADRALARAAVACHPRSAEGHLWLAGSYGLRPTGAQRRAAIASLRRGLALDPTRGPAWRHLGDLLVGERPRAALDAYRQACRHGDPGANGCMLAGATALHLGERALAVALYRRSRWPPAQRIADRLEGETPADQD